MSDAHADGPFRAIVIGSGLAGLLTALEASAAGPVLVLTKAGLAEGATSWAQGGIAAAVGPGDSPDRHLADTIAAGAGLVDEAMARILVESAPACIRALERYGVAFDAEGAGPALGREGAHRRARVLHARGDRTGAAIEAALARRVADGGVTVRERTLATEIVLEDGRAAGVRALDLAGGGERVYEAPAAVLATGGAGAAFAHTTNPPVATADGIALAFDAGAEAADLEFCQFHPTAFRAEGAPPFLISEALRGEGAVLRDARGRAFMAAYHELADLAPRDVVARAMLAEMRAADADCVWLDCTALDGVDAAERFPAIAAFCRGHGIDIRRDPVPVAPAAHYLMGGVRADDRGRTTVPGLYACGETAATGVHGANRLASNSLLETAAFAVRAARHVAEGGGDALPPSADAVAIAPRGGVPPDRAAVQRLLWERAGIERDGAGLRAGLAEARAWPDAAPHASRDWRERRALALFAELSLTAALAREESRGAHFRTDFPERDDARWRRRQVFRRAR